MPSAVGRSRKALLTARDSRGHRNQLLGKRALQETVQHGLAWSCCGNMASKSWKKISLVGIIARHAQGLYKVNIRQGYAQRGCC